ncbi:dienelactone hydrolase family protein [Alkalicoccobacillus gibsonii]|uniref:dienelactone hydrolase family protein n=1 Tax=Alkalicoccobacillus gibsonii TaxID=79881 RepID=UPI001933E843|nr:alpha/beta hydrolase family protein [Alkalicoccobacillus gibsonii]MBM0067579.1 dienelactone hydrolase family protein [Alkalicoccobacillus gibsonii]
MIEPDQFLENLYKQRNQTVLEPSLARMELEKRLGDVPEPSLDVDLTKLETVECIGYTRERFRFKASDDLFIPFYVLTPHTTSHTQFASILALHGHGYGSRELVGLNEDDTEEEGEPGIHRQLAVQLVKKGFKVFVPEILGFGDRRLTKDKEEDNKNSCFTLAAALMMSGSTLAGMRVFEARRMIDVMATFPDVSEEQIGLEGFSGGGLVSALVSALDTRVKATVLTGFANTFKDSILDRNHCLDNYIPGILSIGEQPDLLRLIAPRALFLEAGDEDKVFPLRGVEVAIEQVKNVYKENNMQDQFDSDIFSGGHIINGRKFIDWFERVLTRE